MVQAAVQIIGKEKKLAVSIQNSAATYEAFKKVKNSSAVR